MKNALIVEDLPDIREWLVEVARTAFPGVEVVTKGRREDALAEVARTGFALALVDLGLPDGSGIDVVRTLHRLQPQATAIVVTIYDDDEHLFPALQAGAFGYLLKEQPADALVRQLLRITNGEPPLSPSIARRVLAFFGQQAARQAPLPGPQEVQTPLTDRETEVLQRVAKGYTLPEIALQLGLSRHTVAGYVQQVYRKLDVSSRAEATLEAAKRGLVRP
ncbi:MAG: response regulator transcription factor [Comamonadaceae bacterium]|nr:MAG: response regulator transcription factor [Comamonadaceae bacterium]